MQVSVEILALAHNNLESIDSFVCNINKLRSACADYTFKVKVLDSSNKPPITIQTILLMSNDISLDYKPGADMNKKIFTNIVGSKSTHIFYGQS